MHNKDRWVHVWADRICKGLRPLVIIVVNARSGGCFHAVEDSPGESTPGSPEVLLGLKTRAMGGAPQLAIGDGAQGFRAAFAEGLPATRHQRCWVHKKRPIPVGETPLL